MASKFAGRIFPAIYRCKLPLRALSRKSVKPSSLVSTSAASTNKNRHFYLVLDLTGQIQDRYGTISRMKTKQRESNPAPILFREGSSVVKVYPTVNRIYRTNPATGQRELKSEHPQFTLVYYSSSRNGAEKNDPLPLRSVPSRICNLSLRFPPGAAGAILSAWTNRKSPNFRSGHSCSSVRSPSARFFGWRGWR